MDIEIKQIKSIKVYHKLNETEAIAQVTIIPNLQYNEVYIDYLDIIYLKLFHTQILKIVVFIFYLHIIKEDEQIEF